MASSFLTGVFDFLRRQSRQTLLVAAYLCVILLGIVDYVTPRDLSFLIFYLVPVFVITYYVGSWAGALVSLASTAVWFMGNHEELFASSRTIIPYWNLAEKLGFFFLMTYIIAALRRALEHEKDLARVDALTGLPNRRQLQEKLAAEIVRCRRYRHTFSFAYVDLDDFKAVNDRGGRVAGDALLRTVADAVRGSIRDVDLPARLGGDEFAILMPETGYDAARTVVRNLEENVSAAMKTMGWPTTLSLGLATYIVPVHTADEVIGFADRLMYAAKSAGKNTVIHKLIADAEAPAAGGTAGGPPVVR